MERVPASGDLSFRWGKQMLSPQTNKQVADPLEEEGQGAGGLSLTGSGHHVEEGEDSE